MSYPVFRDISIQFCALNGPIEIIARLDKWISFKQGGTYILNLYFEDASQKDLEVAEAALRRLLPRPSESAAIAEESEWQDAAL